MSKDYAQAVQRVDTWGQVLEAEPGIVHDLIQDIVKIVQSRGDADRIGRRPAARAVGFDDLWKTLVPERFSGEDFPEALRALLGAESAREFAKRVPTSEATMSRFLAGKRTPTLSMMEALAIAGGVTPAYFREWRTVRLAELLRDALMRDPRIASSYAKRMSLASAR